MRLQQLKNKRRARRIIRVRKKVSGSAQCPRLAVSRSHKNIYAQLIDDVAGKTLCAVSTMQKEFKALGYGGNIKAAAAVGKAIAEKAKGLGIAAAAFDRRGQRYHGRIKALADAAREAGLKL